ncbi:hypothetical protein Q4561_04905 [Alteromonas sp. 1_MG-2023]|uniref:hypothetical protein n=1 Tax=Alteromonas sp. 1_MG-2023 TaxID=3062669 RepID=UPI0026E1E6B3|nr:hypothetical protein [Alteromonas sp. 1_MG-2023]MDO6566387.1 hypothetical protein [Alteromonas sp. 1_MG-2023]
MKCTPTSLQELAKFLSYWAQIKNISVLHIDGSAGLAVGLALFAFAGWISELYQLPLNTILFLASANTIYGCYALALALSNKKSLMSIKVLAIANSVWGGGLCCYRRFVCPPSKPNWCVFHLWGSIICRLVGSLRMEE